MKRFTTGLGLVAVMLATLAPMAMGQITINEVKAKGTEFIELYNAGGAPVDVTGWKLENIAGTEVLSGVIAAGGFMSVTTTLDLSNSGDIISLKDNSDALIDDVGYGNFGGAPVGFNSIGRSPDGDDSDDWARDWEYLDSSVNASGETPGTSNVHGSPALGSALIINELDPFGTGNAGALDKIEIYNPTAGPIDLQGYYISDGDGYCQIANSIIVPALGFAVLTEGVAGEGLDCSPAIEWSSSDVAYLYNASAVRIDQLGYSGAPFTDPGDTFQRCGDGVGVNDGYSFASQGGPSVNYDQFPQTLGITNGSCAGASPPALASLQYSPCAPAANASVDLTVIATDVNNDITSVRAFYKLSTDALYDSLDMSVVVDGLYIVSLPGQADQSLVQFYVQARDAVGNVASNPSGAPSFVRSYRVGLQSIASIQGSTVADSCLSSTFVGEAVNVVGIVTHEAYEFSDDFFYIQSGTGPNSGIKIYAPDSLFVPNIGDEVAISGYVEEFRCATEIVMFGGCGAVTGTGDVIPRTLTSLSEINDEVNESMLVTITGPLTAVAGFDSTQNGQFFEFQVHAGGDTAWVGDDTFFPDGIFYTIVPEPGMGFDALTGVIGYRFFSPADSVQTLRLEPRRDNDVDRNWTDVGDGLDVVDAVRKYSLDQNNPNPFNPVTTIEFEVARPGMVQLSVYDVTGRLVRNLVAREYPRPLRDSVVWDGRNEQGKQVPSGVYFYRIDAEGYTATRKMLLLK